METESDRPAILNICLQIFADALGVAPPIEVACVTLPLRGGVPALAFSYETDDGRRCVIAGGDSPQLAAQHCAQKAKINLSGRVFAMEGRETIRECLARNNPDA